jgi:hypothetical protein
MCDVCMCVCVCACARARETVSLYTSSFYFRIVSFVLMEISSYAFWLSSEPVASVKRIHISLEVIYTQYHKLQRLESVPLS